jgi:hypothetical protein
MFRWVRLLVHAGARRNHSVFMRLAPARARCCMHPGARSVRDAAALRLRAPRLGGRWLCTSSPAGRPFAASVRRRAFGRRLRYDAVERCGDPCRWRSALEPIADRVDAALQAEVVSSLRRRVDIDAVDANARRSEESMRDGVLRARDLRERDARRHAGHPDRLARSRLRELDVRTTGKVDYLDLSRQHRAQPNRCSGRRAFRRDGWRPLGRVDGGRRGRT